jgi:hypothetical protein
MKSLLVTTAVVEATTGIALLAVPAIVVSLLLGASLDAAGGIAISRVTGAAMLSLGLACWFARHDGLTRSGRGVHTALAIWCVASLR